MNTDALAEGYYRSSDPQCQDDSEYENALDYMVCLVEELGIKNLYSLEDDEIEKAFDSIVDDYQAREYISEYQGILEDAFEALQEARA